MSKSIFLCIDLKSFYASVECVERGLDSLKTNLVVADESRGPGSICLAVSPSLKELGVRNRCRLFEIPKGIEYISELMGIADPVNMLFFLGFCFSLAIIFALTVAVSRMSVRIKELAQELALYNKKVEERQ